MNFNKHLFLEGKHAYLGASKYHWVNYDDEKLRNSYLRYKAAERGTRLHEFAKEAILLGVRLPGGKNPPTLNLYINDAIGYKMTPEQILFYSDNCFGTADAISFRKNVLRIHDLKTGETKANVTQLEIYAAIFCLEYKQNPNDIEIELRIYQSNEIFIHVPDPKDILYIMQKIIDSDKIIESMQMEE